ncbi:type II and III secretion system protein family protein [Pseudorhodoplanes sp.]|uniref:type II and III secretion system protein family protein n=1 Tax=Pseudorhodoplanes sp. TaxID=1934341 RepID=UPI002B9B1947|nr:type II and III secretion system protein family protein [Pseudorhodoplanes sp.]HWV52153.1 type II and III secretion system protein family protein [Pseudorhodoplanes sp.]
MANQTTIRTLFIVAALATVATTAVHAAEPDLYRTPVISVVGSETSSRPVSLGVGKAVVIDLPRDAKDVLVADPTIANAVVRSARRAYMIGVKVGQTSIFFFDAEGRQIAGFDLAVKRDLNGIREAIRHAVPDSDIRVEALGTDGVVLSGIAATPADAQTAFAVAGRLLNAGTAGMTAAGDKVVNAITVKGRDQINLRVTVAEVQRDVIKQLGVNLNGTVGVGSAVLNFNNQNPFPVHGSALVPENFVAGTFTSGSGNRVNAILRAMERAGVIRTLAEPNLTAISGESANFLAGGEFPILAGYSCDNVTGGAASCQPQIQFKKFGISLGFTPVVLAEGRVSMKVTTEVSELSNEGALQFGVGENARQIPSLKVRRADTTVEIPSGGALALAGLIQEQTKQQINGLPGLMQLPILGALFKSRDYVNRQTELMILVTPYVVRAVAPKDLSRPDDGYADTSDPSSFFMGRLNKIYGIPGKVDPNRMYYGKYGFILD